MRFCGIVGRELNFFLRKFTMKLSRLSIVLVLVSLIFSLVLHAVFGLPAQAIPQPGDPAYCWVDMGFGGDPDWRPIVPEQVWEAEWSKSGRIDRTDVNVRSGPGTHYQIKTTISSGAVIISGYAMDSDCENVWYRVLLVDGTRGWILQQLVTFLDYGQGLFYN